MAAVLARTSSKGRTGSGTTFTISFGTLPAAGSTIVVHVWGWRSGTAQNFIACADNQGVGNTYTRDFQSTAPTGFTAVCAAFRCSNIGATSGTFTLTVTMASGSGVGYAYEVTGLTNTSPGETPATTTDAALNTTCSSGTTGTTSQADEIGFAACCNEGVGTVTYTANAGATSPAGGWAKNDETDNNTFQAGSSAWRVLTATGAINHTWTLNGNNSDSAGIIAYKTSAGGGGGAPLQSQLCLLGVG